MKDKFIRWGSTLILLAVASHLFAGTPTLKQDEKKGSWGYVDEVGKWTIKPKYTKAAPFSVMPDGSVAALVTDKEKSGYISPDGKPLGAGISFLSIDSISSRSAIVKVSDKYGITDWKMNYLLKPEWTEISHLDDNRFLIINKDKCGVADADGNIIVPVQFSKIEILSPGFYLLQKNGQSGVFDGENARIIVPVEYAEVSIPVKINETTFFPLKNKKGHWGVLSEDGKDVAGFVFSSVASLPELNAILLSLSDARQKLYLPAANVLLDFSLDQLKKEGPFSIVQGRMLKPSDPSALRIWSEIAPTGTIGRVLDSKGSIVSTYPSPKVSAIEDGYLVQQDSNSNAFFSKEGNLIADNLNGSYSRNGKWYVFDNMAISPEYKKYNVKREGDILMVSDATASGEEKWNVLLDGQLSAEGYDTVEPFMKDFMADAYDITKSGKHGILYRGKEIIPCEFSDIPAYLPNPDLLVMKEDNGEKSIFSLNGKKIWSGEVDDIFFLFLKHGFLEKNKKYGLVYYDEEADSLIQATPIEFDALNRIEDTNFLWANKGNLFGDIDFLGNSIVPVSFSSDCLTYEDPYFIAKKGNKRIYYNYDGSINPAKREIVINSAHLEHNIYNNGAKGFKIHFDFDSHFLNEDGEEIYVEALIYNKNGTPAKSTRGGQVKHSFWRKPPYLNTHFSNQWVFLPYNNFVQGKGSHDYYIVLRFQDESNRLLPVSGNTKLNFTLTR
ncbi:MAG: WG repeat-containing protein [Bacteroidales bacterium]|nr:WG repeat-containing protein [Bacteroidales bacterium]